MPGLVEVARFQTLPEAVVAQSCLEAYGHAVIAMEHNHAFMAWHHLFALGGVRLAAPAEEAEEASALLETLAREGALLLAADPLAARAVPSILKRVLAVVLVLALGVIVPPQTLTRRTAR